MAEQNCAGKVSKIKNFFRKMWTYLCRILKKRHNVQEQPNDPEPETTENPWIFATRSIIEQILWQKQDVIREEKEELGGRLTRKQLYRDFKPLIIDTDTPDQVFGEGDDVDQILRQLSPGLNFLEICTNRPEDFVSFTVWLEMEYGLMTRIFPLDAMRESHANVVLDLERQGIMYTDRLMPKVLYVPFYKRRWKIHETAVQTEEEKMQNLDIEVPIGYNVLIVKVDKTLQN